MVTAVLPMPANAPSYWADACKHLMKRDRVMKKLIPQFPGATLQSRGDAFTTTNGHAFNVYITKINNISTAFVEALQ